MGLEKRKNVIFLSCLTMVLLLIPLTTVNRSSGGETTEIEPGGTIHPSNRSSSGEGYFNFIPTTPLPTAQRGDKWVVITTINHPTDAIKTLAQLPGWRVVVVADKKTPTDWSFPNCDFLSVEKQKQLGYRVTDLLPFNHYGRKNIGYLYAIQHGATIIYETDDDNILSLGNIVVLPAQTSIRNVVPTDIEGSTVNPYANFGEPTIWPRGYPLERIMHDRDAASYQLTHPIQTNLYIQQGLANKDPDVDAIFRLTRNLNITFTQEACPIAYPPKVMAPFNSQNTLFHYEALWGLMIPITTTFRVCDIWRGYWTQRLLWEIGGSLGFLPPSVIQNRNAHHLLADFIDEDDLYKDAGKLIKFLRSWTPTRTSFFERVMELSIAMAQEGFWEEGDATLTQAWLHDLLAVGYRQPKLSPAFLEKGLQNAVSALPKAGEPKVSNMCETKVVHPVPTEPVQRVEDKIQLFTILLDTADILPSMRDFVGLLHARDYQGSLLVYYAPTLTRAMVAELGNLQGINMVNLKFVMPALPEKVSTLTQELMEAVLEDVLSINARALYVSHEIAINAPPAALATAEAAIKHAGYAAMKKVGHQLQLLPNEAFIALWSDPAQFGSLAVLATDSLRSLHAPALSPKDVVQGIIADPPEAVTGQNRPWCYLRHKIGYPPMNIKANMIPASNNALPKICILLPTVGRSVDGRWATQPGEVEGFQKFVAPFLDTTVPAYNFSVYFGFDIGDNFYDSPANQQTGIDWIKARVPQGNQVNVYMKAFPKSFTNNVYFWNHLAYEAYKDGCDYNFQMGDDMKLIGKGWDLLIDQLKTKTQTPNFGVIEPRHTGGNTRVHVISFVHRTHYEIFGHHFPPEFFNWWADDWMTDTYKPFSAALWLDGGMSMTHLVHQRYSHCPSHEERLPGTLARSHQQINDFLASKKAAS